MGVTLVGWLGFCGWVGWVSFYTSVWNVDSRCHECCLGARIGLNMEIERVGVGVSWGRVGVGRVGVRVSWVLLGVGRVVLGRGVGRVSRGG